MSDKVSIIIPVYNVEKYINQCLQSVVGQTYKNCEVIIVNDGSTDDSIEIIERYKKSYPEITVVNKKNGGLGAARNEGLKYVTGKYIVFIDSDDYLSTNYIEDLYKNIKTNDCDMSICGFEKFYDFNNKKELVKLDSSIDFNKVYTNFEVLDLIFYNKIFCHAWNKMYKRELFEKNNIVYEEGKLYEDIYTTVKLVSKAKKIFFVDEELYMYRIREGNITSISNRKSIEDYNYAIMRVNEYFQYENLLNASKENLINFNLAYTLSSLDMFSKYKSYNIINFYKEYNELYKDLPLDYSMLKVLLSGKIQSWVKRDYFLLKLGLLPLKNKIRDSKIEKEIFN